MPFNDVSTSNSDLLPIEWSREVIKAMAEQSVVMGLSRRMTMSTRQQVLPAAAALAQAYWVGGVDSSGLKQTTKNLWAGVYLRVEELAALVAIPNAHMADNAFPVWEETRPSVVEAMGAVLDAATMFGVNKPTSWPAAIYPSILNAGNARVVGTGGTDLAEDIALSARDLRRNDGARTTAFACEPGFQWELVSLRSTDGHPIYTTNLAGPIPTGIYGFPLMEAGNQASDQGMWVDEAKLIHGDWSKSIVGIREDISFSQHDSGVITNESGQVIFNAMQQDSTIWRAVFRVAWATANPVTRINPTVENQAGLPTSRYWFAAIQSTTANS